MSAVVPDVWLGEALGVPSYRVEVEARVEPWTELEQHLGEQARAFYYAKVDTRHTDRVRGLAALGFSLVDTSLLFEHARPPQVELAFPGISIGELESRDEAAVIDIANRAFRFSRFHLDPEIPPSTANRIKAEWCRAYARGTRGDHLFVARCGDTPAGFLAALVCDRPDGRSAIIDLVAVAPEFQRRRVGAGLLAAFLQHYRAPNVSLLVGTQVTNVPSVRLYERFGFSLQKSQYVLHLHLTRPPREAHANR